MIFLEKPLITELRLVWSWVEFLYWVCSVPVWDHSRTPLSSRRGAREVLVLSDLFLLSNIASCSGRLFSTCWRESNYRSRPGEAISQRVEARNVLGRVSIWEGLLFCLCLNLLCEIEVTTVGARVLQSCAAFPDKNISSLFVETAKRMRGDCSDRT